MAALSWETPTSNPAMHPVGDIEPRTHAFVIKVWCEETEPSANRATWRGYSTHVASGQRRYVMSLGELNHFIGLYLRKLNVRLPLFWRICQWLNR